MITSALFDVYLQYKTSTATVLEWLNNSGAISSQSSITVNQLHRASENARNKNIQVPEAVYRAFRDSVAKWRKVTSWFTSAEHNAGGEISQSTLNHVHFTEKLEEAFSILFPKKRELSSHSRLVEAEDETVPKEAANRFRVLDDHGFDMMEALDIRETEDVIPGSSPPAPEKQALVDSDIRTLEDDPFAALIRIHLLMRELDSICETVKSFWEQASDRTLPLPFVAWLTNTAYAAAKRLCARVADVDKDAQEHQEVYIDVVNQFNIVFNSCPIEPKYDYFTQGRGMTFPWIAVVCAKAEWKNDKAVPLKSAWQDPVKCISPSYKPEDEGDSLGKDLNTYQSIIASILQLRLREKDETREVGFTPSYMNPLLSDVSTFLESEDQHPTLGLVFGVHLFLETYRSFIWKSQSATKLNCRLEALRFAKEVKEMVQFPLLHSCDPTVHILQIVDASFLDEFLAERRFDLYYQSPWTAGFHMCEILHLSIDEGLRLWNSEGRVGAVLHVYNALRQLKSIDTVPLLDDLCEIFRKETFLGSLPNKNFSSHFRRFLGGTVQVEASQTSSLDTRQGRRGIGLPAKLPGGEDYWKRLMPGGLSLFYELYNKDFATTNDFWSRVYAGKSSAALTPSQLDRVIESVHSTPFNEPLAKINTVVIEEFTGRAPVACIKYHSIYALSLQILKDMATLKLQEDDRPAESASPALGFTFVETLLVAIVEHQKSAQLSKMLPYAYCY